MNFFFFFLGSLVGGAFISIHSVVAWVPTTGTPLCSRPCIGNNLIPSCYPKSTRLWSTASSSDIVFESFDGTTGVDKKLIQNVSQFMMESFWGVEAGADKYSALLAEQEEDLNERFGEILGRRKLQTQLIVGRTQERMEGSVGVEVALLDLKHDDILSYSQSEKTLNGAVAALGPKERRQYKDCTIVELVAGLPTLGGQYEAVAVLANLCVSSASRGNGVGQKLCKEVESVVKDWGIGKIALKVEAGNTPARNLYTKLGYKEEVSRDDSITIRPDLENGKFQEMPCTMLILTKTLGTS